MKKAFDQAAFDRAEKERSDTLEFIEAARTAGQITTGDYLIAFSLWRDEGDYAKARAVVERARKRASEVGA